MIDQRKLKIFMKNHKIKDKYQNKNIEYNLNKIMINLGDKILMIIKRLMVKKKMIRLKRVLLMVQKILWKDILVQILILFNKY